MDQLSSTPTFPDSFVTLFFEQPQTVCLEAIDRLQMPWHLPFLVEETLVRYEQPVNILGSPQIRSRTLVT